MLSIVFDYRMWFQSKLNCEVLDDSVAFEVRWAVAGDSIVVQLVAKLGKYKSIIQNHCCVNKSIPLKNI